MQKPFTNHDAYERELAVYNLKLDYVPKLIAYDSDKRSIIMENVGTPVGGFIDTFRHLLPTFLTDRLPDQRKRYETDVRMLYYRFHEDTGLHHNDVQYKNVLRNKDGQLFLIDFEFTSSHPREDRCHGRKCSNLDNIIRM